MVLAYLTATLNLLTLEDHPLPSTRPRTTRCRFPPEKDFLSMPRMAYFPALLRSQNFAPTLKIDATTLAKAGLC